MSTHIWLVSDSNNNFFELKLKTIHAVYVYWQKISSDVFFFFHISMEKLDLIPNASCRCSLCSGVNVYWSRKTWACKFWFVCVCCLDQSSCRVESITIGMWTWLLKRLWKSHRPMIKNSVQASLQPHHSGCPNKERVHWLKKKKKKKSNTSQALS